MKQSENIVVDGKSYTINPYITSTGVMLWWDIISKFGEGIVSFAFQLKESMGEKDSVQNLLKSEVKPEQISQLMAGVNRMSPEQFQSFISRVLANTCVGSRSVMEDYETRFTGQYKHLMKLVFKTLEVQFRDFFTASGANVGVANSNPA
jgi:hypothetical protein